MISLYGQSKILVGFYFDVREYDGEYYPDIDLSAFLLGDDGKVSNNSDFVFYGSMFHPSRAVELAGSLVYRPCYEECFELMMVDFSNIPANISRIVFTVTIYDAEEHKHNFGQVSNKYIRVVDESNEQELIRYDLGEKFSSETAIIIGEFYRNGEEWRFNAECSGFKGGLEALCKNFGVNV